MDNLSDEEKRLLEEMFALFERGPRWNSFSSTWIRKCREILGREVQTTNSAYKICQDLEMRLDIKQGYVAPPDHIDVLHDLIDEYGRERLLQETQINPNDLSRIFAGKKHLVGESYNRILSCLGVDEKKLEARISV